MWKQNTNNHKFILLLILYMSYDILTLYDYEIDEIFDFEVSKILRT